MNIAVIFAGGSGKRMHSKDLPKQFLEMHGKPIIVYTLEVFEKHPEIDAIVVACKKEWIEFLWDLISKYSLSKVVSVVPGGTTGQESIYNGLMAAKEIAKEKDSFKDAIVLIHDGVRPLINQQVITDNINSVRINGTAITTAKVTETILVVRDDESIDYVPDREHSRVAKAPQSFMLKDILEAHNNAIKEGRNDYIDSCSLMKHYGHSLFLVDGPSENIKITTPSDFYILRAIIDERESAQLYN